MATPEKASPSAARSLSPEEVEQLAALGLALPPGWVLYLEPPHGQLAWAPRREARLHYRCWVVDPQRRVIHRQRWQV